MKKVICILTMPFVCIRVSVKQCTISGTMTDKNKGPTTGLNILVKRMSNGVLTNLRGKFTLMVNRNLLFKYLFLERKCDY